MTASPRLSAADIKAMLVDRIAELASVAAPDGKRHGRYWLAHAPLRIDKNPSFAIWLTGLGAGAFKDFADEAMKGDAIDLIGACILKRSDFQSREARAEALGWARDWLGLSGREPAQARELAKEAKAKNREREAKAEQEERDRFRKACQIWGEGKAIGGTPVETYLREARGIDIFSVPNPEHFLRFHPKLHHPYEPHVGPAMLAGFKRDGAFCAVHCTYLREDGRGKADIAKAKIIRGSYAGAAIHVSRGPSNLRASEAAEAGVKGMLAVTEGIEDALTVARERPEWRCWAAGSLGNLGEIVPPICADALMICADADTKPQAVASLNLGVTRQRGRGLPVGLAFAFGGAKDFNDLLRGA